MTTVLNYHRQIEEEQERAAKRAEAEAAAQQHAQEVRAAVAQQEALSAPVEKAFQENVEPATNEDDEILRVPFVAIATRRKLRGLKNYMKENGIHYE